MLDLLDRIRIVDDEKQLSAMLEALSGADRPVVLSFLNQHGFNLASADPAMRQRLLQSDLLLRDGVGLEIAFKLLGRRGGRNCNGTDLIPRLLDMTKGRPVVVIGTREPWLSEAIRRLEGSGNLIVASVDGFQPDRIYVSLVRDRRPAVVLLGMGMPRQEMLAEKLRAAADGPCLIINGGAILDFLAGRFPRAPLWIRAMRLEWLFRLMLEPRRLANRYLSGGLTFGINLIKLASTTRSASNP